MIAALVAVLVLSALFAVAAPGIARRLHPALATRLLVPASVLVAAASTFALGVAAFTLVGQYSEIAELGPWSPAKLRHDTPVPAAAAVVGALVLAYVVASTVALVSRRSVALVRAHRTCGRLGAPGSLVVLDSDTPDAFTTPEVTGRIVVTKGMLNALSVEEQAAMLAHEASHVRHRHAWWLLAVDVAAAVNPMLRSTAHTMRQAVERWADEDAARSTANRRTVAHALARAALAAHAHHGRPAHLPAAVGGNVPARVNALLAPPVRKPRSALAAIAVAILLIGGVAASSLDLQQHGDALFEHVMYQPLDRGAAR